MSSDTDLFASYLQRLRAEKLQQSHGVLLGEQTDEGLRLAKVHAHEAELVKRIAGALTLLDKDPAKFVKDHLQ